MASDPYPWSFLFQFVANPLRTGAILPSSRRLATTIVAAIPVQQARIVVEYGPGTGTITRALLQHLHPDARLFLFETNDAFCELLQKEFRDPRVEVVDQSASRINEVLLARGIYAADCIVSGLPFRTFPLPLTLSILKATRQSMHSGSVFTAFQYTTHIEPILRGMFDRVTRVRRVWKNIPPALVYRCQVTSNAYRNEPWRIESGYTA